MGSLAPEIDGRTKEVDVLVTGFGAFGENTTNPSYLIARSLPTRLERPHLPAINIYTHPTPITVAYSYVREVIPRLLFSNDGSRTRSPDIKTVYYPADDMRVITQPSQATPKYDIVLNIGMAPGRRFFTLETCAHRDGYNKKDVEGKTLVGDTFWKDTYKSPEILHSSFDTEDVWRRWKSEMLDEDVRPSNNAGHYLCDFTYYASMVEYWRRDPEGHRPCMFLHVPGGWAAENVLEGKQVALGLIAACVGSERARGKDKKVTGIEDTVADDFKDDLLLS